HNTDLNQYVEMSEKMISQGMITDGNIISSNRIKTKETEFQKVIYTGKRGVFDLKFVEYYWVQNNKAYVLTLRCQVNEFNSFNAIWKKILNSFKIK
ncbi:hypothetical protein N9R81_02690, partial [Flavobacteriales bacterium]|nr:hypothetical protein [Flavobacteriales bacterium]